MDEPMKKSGQWPNVAIVAGSDPGQVMKHYGVKPSMNDLWNFIGLVKKDHVERSDDERS